MSGETIKSYNM